MDQPVEFEELQESAATLLRTAPVSGIAGLLIRLHLAKSKEWADVYLYIFLGLVVIFSIFYFILGMKNVHPNTPPKGFAGNGTTATPSPTIHSNQ